MFEWIKPTTVYNEIILRADAFTLSILGKTFLQEYQLEVIRCLLVRQKRGGWPSSGEIPMRLMDHHFPSLMPSPEEKKIIKQKTCCLQTYTCKRTEEERVLVHV